MPFWSRNCCARRASESMVQRARLLADARKLIRDAACVLLDLGLPDSQGLDGLRQLLRQEPDVAVVVLTGLADEYLGEEAVRAGAQDYLVKGDVTGKMLHRVIRYAMERRRWDEAQRQLHGRAGQRPGERPAGARPAALAGAGRPAAERRGAVPGRRQAAASRRGFLRRGADPGWLGARADRRCLRARPFRGRARGLPAGGVAGAGAVRPAAGRTCSPPSSSCSSTSSRTKPCSPPSACCRWRPTGSAGSCGWPATRRRCWSPGRDNRAHRARVPAARAERLGRAGPGTRWCSATAGRCCCTPTG